ncbi:hypothetical protein [Streptomyces sannanensis]|uniref:hypothetical protein n=1 Tax=Streptomyces sannanensis TaxID=285536 RepID=UPI0031E96FD0
MAELDGDGNRYLEVDGVTLQAFKARMEELLRTLNESPAQHTKIGDQTITADSYGTGFAAADELAKAYDKVRSRLETLTRTFGEQIEAMGIAVHIADKGYGGVDVDEARRFEEIRKATEKVYETPQTKPTAPTAPKTTGAVKSGDF